MDNSCNNVLNSTFNNESQNNTRWSYSGTASLVEPEILEDMGVGMLEDENCTKTLESEKCTTVLPINLNHSKRLTDKTSGFECQEEVYTSSNLETINAERFVMKNLF